MRTTVEQAEKVRDRVAGMLSDFEETTVEVTEIGEYVLVTVRVYDTDPGGLLARLVRTGVPVEIDDVIIEVRQCRVPVMA